MLVPFTTSQLPPIGKVPIDKVPSFDARLARFDRKLSKMWEKELPPTDMPGAFAVGGHANGPYLILSATADALLARCVDDRAKEQWRAEVKIDGFYLPLAAIGSDKKWIAIGNYNPDLGQPAAKMRTQVMIVVIEPSAKKRVE